MSDSRDREIIMPGSDEAFFRDHPERQIRIRLPRSADEFRHEFTTLGDHAYYRRRIIAARGFIPFGPKVIHIPFLAFADETIEDRDEVLLPILNEMMSNAAKDYGLKPDGKKKA